MHELVRRLAQESTFIHLSSPPGSGKTRLALCLMMAMDDYHWIYVVPLRAVALEVKKKCEKSHIKCQVILPEEFKDIDKKKMGPTKIIIDEFHLFFYWGDSFRHSMTEALYRLASSEVTILSLSATLEKEMLTWPLGHINSGHDYVYHFDYGNRQHNTAGTKTYYYPPLFGLSWMKRRLHYDLARKGHSGVYLFFCQTKEQVRQIKNQFRAVGYSVLSCIGGETKEFVEKLERSRKVDLIVATEALSHGVNLPSIDRVYMNYRVRDFNMWMQMAGRAGRSGKGRVIHTLDDFSGPSFIRYASWIKCMAWDIYLKKWAL